jgi:pyruvate dehydrogenase E2 component (dihydrolipoyllysine-residue acetyltransferase)
MSERVPFLLPDLGEGMAEAEIVRWEVAVGDHVARDQVVVVVQTDKAEVELPAPAAGTIAALGADVGDLVAVGEPLLELVRDDSAAPTEPTRPSQPASPEGALRPSTTQVRGGGSDGKVQAAPPVRKLAKELGVDLGSVAGTGPGGRVTAADVNAVARGSGARPRESVTADGERRVALRGIPRAMARNMADAWRAVPHISLFDEIDARDLIEALSAARNLTGSESLTLTAFFVRASVLALEAQPILNASLDEAADEIVYHDAVHVGIAVATDEGLVVPVVRDAHELGFRELGEAIVRVTAEARAGGLSPDALRGATFSVTNFGTEGGRFATPIVRPPQVAILGVGAIRPRPVVDGDRVVAAPALPLSLSADHRVVDGYNATRFLDAVAQSLLEPLSLLADH